MAETPPVRLIVLGPGRQVYGTRALVAGDEFEMSREYADILIRLGKARLADEKRTPTTPVVQAEKAAAKAEVVVSEPDQLERLRGEARALGIQVDYRWGVVRLNYEIAQKKLQR